MKKEETSGNVPLERQVRRHFCHECAFCGDKPYDHDKTKRECAVAGERRSAHLKARKHTPDAYFTAPEAWVYVNSHFDCGWFQPKDTDA